MPSKTLADSVELIRERKDFQIGNIMGEAFTKPNYPNGLNYRIHPGWNKGPLFVPLGARYVLYSYRTPIAWIDDLGRAVFCPQTFSTSTTRHMGYFRAALRDDPCTTKALAAKRDTRDRKEEKLVRKWREEKEYERKEERREAARRERARRREDAESERLLAEERAREKARLDAEVQAAIDSLTKGTPMPPVVLGIEGEIEAMQSVADVMRTRNATDRRVITRTSRA